MHLQKRGSTWHCEYYDAAGERIRRSTQCTDRRAAEARAIAWEREAATADASASRSGSLADAINLLIETRAEQAEAGRRSVYTVEFYRRKAGHLRRIFETNEAGEHVPFNLGKLNSSEIDRYVSQRRAEGASENTIQKELVTLRAALKLARRAGLWHGEPAAIVPVAFSAEYKPRTRFLTREELHKLLAELLPDQAARVAYMVATSAEWSATERAMRTDVASDLSTAQLHGTKRSSREREVPIVTGDQYALLGYALKYAQGDGRSLFQHWGNVRRDLHEACDRAGIAPCSPNDLRRTCATWLRAAGVPAELIAPLMGHRDTRMVERVYGRLAPKDLWARIAGSLRSGTVSPVCQTQWTEPDLMDTSDRLDGCVFHPERPIISALECDLDVRIA